MTLYEISEQKLRYLRYSENTAKIYLHYIDEFEKSLSKHYSRITSKDIQEYLNCYSFTSASTQNQIVSALKFAWTKGLGKKYLKVDFTRPRSDKKLPRVIDHDFLTSRITEIKNLKHKAILTIAYSVGLRVSEVINLKIADIDSKRMVIYIKNAKGRKDRILPLSKNCLKVLRRYFREYRPAEYLFTGQKSPKYSAVSCNKIVKKYLGEQYHFHLLRHSACTRLLETGVDLRIIQSIAGHKKSSTTERYTHVSQAHLQSIQLPA